MKLGKSRAGHLNEQLDFLLPRFGVLTETLNLQNPGMIKDKHITPLQMPRWHVRLNNNRTGLNPLSFDKCRAVQSSGLQQQLQIAIHLLCF